jgi:hypothetical protein
LNPDKVTIDVGPNLTVAQQDSVSIELSTNVSPNAVGSIEWSPTMANLVKVAIRFEFIAATSATISSMITDTSDVLAEDSMRTHRNRNRVSYFVPNVFSPNGDGSNEHFTIYEGST